MINCSTLSVGDKAVKYMTIDGKIVFSTDPDNSESLYELEDFSLSTATVASPAGSYTPPGDTNIYTYDIYQLSAEKFWGGGSGTNHLFPISQHIFARAAHWGQLTANFYPGNTNSVTAPTSECVNLTAWAKTNGFDSDYVDSLNVGDIQMIYTTNNVLTVGVYTEDDIPYVIPEIQFKGMFHRDVLSGLVGYCGTQLTAYSGEAQPVVFGNPIAGEVAWSAPQRYKSFLPVEDYTAYIRSDSIGPTYLGTTGDSGKPVYMTIGGGKNILVSHNH